MRTAPVEEIGYDEKCGKCGFYRKRLDENHQCRELIEKALKIDPDYPYSKVEPEEDDPMSTHTLPLARLMPESHEDTKNNDVKGDCPYCSKSYWYKDCFY